MNDIKNFISLVNGGIEKIRDFENPYKIGLVSVRYNPIVLYLMSQHPETLKQKHLIELINYNGDDNSKFIFDVINMLPDYNFSQETIGTALKYLSADEIESLYEKVDIPDDVILKVITDNAENIIDFLDRKNIELTDEMILNAARYFKNINFPDGIYDLIRNLDKDRFSDISLKILEIEPLFLAKLLKESFNNTSIQITPKHFKTAIFYAGKENIILEFLSTIKGVIVGSDITTKGEYPSTDNILIDSESVDIILNSILKNASYSEIYDAVSVFISTLYKDLSDDDKEKFVTKDVRVSLAYLGLYYRFYPTNREYIDKKLAKSILNKISKDKKESLNIESHLINNSTKMIAKIGNDYSELKPKALRLLKFFNNQ